MAVFDSQSPTFPRVPGGYRVVEVANEQVPPQPLPAVLAPAEETINPPEPPLSLYWPHLVAKDNSPFRESRTQRCHAHESSRGNFQRAPRWLPVAIGGLILAVWTIVFIVIAQSRVSTQPVSTSVPNHGVVLEGQPGVAQVVIPKVDPREAAKPVNPLPLPENPAPPEKKPGLPADDQETFGTEVSFARNRLQASRLAAQAGKLTFLLHVSGNFEDAGFT